MPAVIPLVAAVVGGAMAAKSSKDASKAAAEQNQAQIEANQVDPRATAMLYGNGGDDPGILQGYRDLLDKPQSAAMQQAGTDAGNYLTQNGAADMDAVRSAGQGLLSGIAAPTMQAANAQGFHSLNGTQANAGPSVGAFGAPVQWNTGESYSAPDAMKAAQVGAPQQVTGATVNQPQGMLASLASATKVNAPSQNGMDLRGSYDAFINGERGNNPYLTGAIGKGINQSNTAFENMQDNSTRNLLENILPSIRSSSVLAGQYGGSRQGIAEGRALGDFGREQQRAISQFGQNNTDAAVSAQAGAYESDSSRALSATQGLGAQQYGVAQQDAAAANAVAMQNAQNAQSAAQTNFGGLLSGSLANAGYGQQAALANQQAGMAQQQTNAGFQQQANATNYAGQLGVNQGNAALAQQANMGNQAAGNAASMFNAGQQQTASSQNASLGQQNNQFNAGLTQANNQFNGNLLQQNSQYNAGLQQQAGQSNLQAQLGTNQLNSANTAVGSGLLSGLSATAYGQAGAQDQYDINRAQQVGGLLQPYLSKNPTPTQLQPTYSNTAGNVMGGAMGGLALYNQFRGMGGSTPPPSVGMGDAFRSNPFGTYG